jgi:hypothetical protein
MKQLISILLVLASFASVGQDIGFYVATDAPILDASTKTYQVLSNSVFQVSFVVENGTGTEFSPPNFTGLSIISGPMTSTEVSIINGRKSEKRSFIYSIVGNKEGVYTIESASIKTSKGTLFTNPFKVKISKGTDQEESQVNSTFVRVELSDSTTFIGQQIIFELKLYTRENVKSYEALTDFNYDGFYVRNLNEFSRKSSRIILNGKDYYSTTLKAVALFPQQTGTYTIPSFAVRVGIPKTTGRRTLFSFQEYEYKVLNTEEKKIEVSDVPFGAPLSFSGAVGKFNVSFRIDKQSVSTDDNITMIMEVRGDGDSKKIISPMIDLGEDFEIYEPNLLRDEEYVDGGKVINYKNYEFLIVPKKEGIYRLEPEFTYFNVDSNSYITLKRNPPFRVRVAKGSGSLTDLSDIENRNLAADMPMGNLTKPSYKFAGSALHTGLLSFLLLGILGMIGHQKYMQHLAGIDPAIKNKKRANKVALKRLESAKQYLDKSQEKKFYDEISKAVIKYSEDKLTIVTGSLAKDQLIKTLNTAGVSVQTTDRILELLNKAEISLYAGGKTGQMEAMYKNALDIISDIEDLDFQ